MDYLIPPTPPRLREFDIMKGFGILLVVLGHLNIPSWLHTWIYGFHMPLFFFVAGFFYKKDTITITLQKSFHQLIIPYVFFFFSIVTVDVFLNIYSCKDLSSALSITLSKISFIDRSSMNLIILWFLLCLFWVRIIFNILDTCLPNKLYQFIFCIFCYIISTTFFSIPLCIDSALSVLIYYFIGSIFPLINSRLNFFSKYYLTLFILYTTIILTFNIHPDFRTNVCPPSTLVISLLMIFGIFYFSKNLSSMGNILIKLIEICGIFSLGILGFHSIVWKIYYTFAYKLGIEPYGFPSGIIKFIIGVCFSIFLTNWINQKFPKLLGKTKVLSLYTQST